jgi:hypothetical protein
MQAPAQTMLQKNYNAHFANTEMQGKVSYRTHHD